MTGEGIIIQHMLYLFTQPVERLTVSVQPEPSGQNLTN
ncbi:hypothetical protein SD22575_2360 [Shigella dysenteriae 225-75]|nr:hypothetical protein SD22575_2360 [Shigella dysenteriae 225-75]